MQTSLRFFICTAATMTVWSALAVLSACCGCARRFFSWSARLVPASLPPPVGNHAEGAGKLALIQVIRE
jgi:hypothetical protein